MYSPHELIGEQGKQNWERMNSPLPQIPAMVSNGGSTTSITSPNGVNIVSPPVDVRFNVEVYDDGSGVIDSNGYYKVIKSDQWFGLEINQVLFQLRLDYPDGGLSEGDLVFVESYSTTHDSPSSPDDGYLLCRPLLSVSKSQILKRTGAYPYILFTIGGTPADTQDYTIGLYSTGFGADGVDVTYTANGTDTNEDIATALAAACAAETNSHFTDYFAWTASGTTIIAGYQIDSKFIAPGTTYISGVTSSATGDGKLGYFANCFQVYIASFITPDQTYSLCGEVLPDPPGDCYCWWWDANGNYIPYTIIGPAYPTTLIAQNFIMGQLIGYSGEPRPIYSSALLFPWVGMNALTDIYMFTGSEMDDGTPHVFTSGDDSTLPLISFPCPGLYEVNLTGHYDITCTGATIRGGYMILNLIEQDFSQLQQGGDSIKSYFINGSLGRYDQLSVSGWFYTDRPNQTIALSAVFVRNNSAISACNFTFEITAKQISDTSIFV